MSIQDTYQKYAADCMRLAENESSPEARNLMLNMALAWARLAQQKQAIKPSVRVTDDALHGAETVTGDAPPTAPTRPH